MYANFELEQSMRDEYDTGLSSFFHRFSEVVCHIEQHQLTLFDFLVSSVAYVEILLYSSCLWTTLYSSSLTEYTTIFQILKQTNYDANLEFLLVQLSETQLFSDQSCTQNLQWLKVNQYILLYMYKLLTTTSLGFCPFTACIPHSLLPHSSTGIILCKITNCSLHNVVLCFLLKSSIAVFWLLLVIIDITLEFEDSELYQHFEAFYNDVLPEFKAAGRVVQLKVCCNYEQHLRGNVYVQYARLIVFYCSMCQSVMFAVHFVVRYVNTLGYMEFKCNLY